MKPTVLITGGSGLLAINWALALRDRYSVVLGMHKRIIACVGINTLQINLENTDQLTRTLRDVNPQVVVHTAGLTNVDECEIRPELAQHINVELAANVAQVSSKLGLQLIHISTDHLFSGDASLVDEFHPIVPKNVYGRTKAEAEYRVLDAYAQALIIRTNFYGWGPSYRRSFSDHVLETLRAGNELSLFKDVFYTPILAETVSQVAHDLLDLKTRGIYHIVGDERISKFDFGVRLADVFGFDPSMIKEGFLSDHPTLVQRPYDMSLSNKRVCDLLGRKLGGVDEQIVRLCHQEQTGLAQEIRNI